MVKLALAAANKGGWMEWWQEARMRLALEETLAGVREARQAHHIVRRCQRLLTTLDPLAIEYWTQFPAHRPQNRLRDDMQERSRSRGLEHGRKYRHLIKSGIPTRVERGGLSRRDWLCEHSSLRRLADFTPRIMSDTSLAEARAEGRYDRDKGIDDDVRMNAERSHTAFAMAYSAWYPGQHNADRDDVLWYLADLFWTVRSNLQHAYKRPSSPDRIKRERDRAVCAVIQPVVEAVYEALFDFPCTRLATYGTLRPGQPNHDVIAGVQGAWVRATVDGILEQFGELAGLAWGWDAPQQRNVVPVQVLVSQDLPRAWRHIDHREGDGYQRILVPVNLPDGRIIIANLYEIADVTL